MSLDGRITPFATLAVVLVASSAAALSTTAPPDKRCDTIEADFDHLPKGNPKDFWARYLRLYERNPPCMDGYFGEGVSDSTATWLKVYWSSISQLKNSSPAFRKFLFNCLNSTDTDEQMAAIEKVARRQCPADMKDFCLALGNAAREVRGELDGAAPIAPRSTHALAAVEFVAKAEGARGLTIKYTGKTRVRVNLPEMAQSSDGGRLTQNYQIRLRAATAGAHFQIDLKPIGVLYVQDDPSPLLITKVRHATAPAWQSLMPNGEGSYDLPDLNAAAARSFRHVKAADIAQAIRGGDHSDPPSGHDQELAKAASACKSATTDPCGVVVQTFLLRIRWQEGTADHMMLLAVRQPAG